MVQVRIGSAPIRVSMENTAEARRQAGLAADSAELADLSAQTALAAGNFIDGGLAAGEAATSDGDFFAVEEPAGVISYRMRDAVGSHEIAAMVSAAALASETGPEKVGYKANAPFAILSHVKRRLWNLPLRPEDGGAFGSDPAANTTLLNAWLAELGNGVNGDWDGLDREISARMQIIGATDFQIMGRAKIKIADGVALDESKALMLVQECEDFQIADLIGDGNRDGRSPAEASGHLMRIIGNKRGRFLRCLMKNGITDNWYIRGVDPADADTYPTEIILDQCGGLNAYRNNASIIGSKDCKVLGGFWKGANGTAPEAGIGIEANSTDVYGNVNLQILDADCSDNEGFGFYSGSAHLTAPNNGEYRVYGRGNGEGLAQISRCNGVKLAARIGDHPGAGVTEGIVDITGFARNVTVDAETSETITTTSSGNYIVAVAQGPRGTAVWDPASVPASGSVTSADVGNAVTITVTGALQGEKAIVEAPYALGGLVATAEITAADTAVITLTNPTGGAVDLGSGTWVVQVPTNNRVDRIVAGKSTIPALKYGAASGSVGVVESNDCSDSLTPIYLTSTATRVRVQKAIARRCAGYGLYCEAPYAQIDSYEIEDFGSAVSGLRFTSTALLPILRNGKIKHTSGSLPSTSVRAIRFDTAPRAVNDLQAPEYSTANIFTGGVSLFASAMVSGIVPDITSGSATYNPSSIAADGSTTTTITVPYANVGDKVIVTAPYDLQGIIVSAYVSAQSTVTVRLHNPTTGAIDLASGTWLAKVIKS